MEYTVEDLNINDPKIRQSIAKLVGEVFQMGNLNEDRIALNTQTNSSKPSLYLGAILDGEIIGFNAFISHEFQLNSNVISCFQSCWTATDPNHRGKRIFQNLIDTGKEKLKEQGASFIFGFPNDNSQPIFTKKLGFREIPSYQAKIWNIPGGIKRGLANLNLLDLDKLNSNTFLQNDKQLISLKLNQFGDDVKAIEYNGNLIWGKIRTGSKFGISFKYFDVGGIQIQDILSLPTLIKKVFTEHKCLYAQIISCATNSYLELFKNIEGANTNDLILFDLNTNTEEFNFNLFNGVKDVF